MSERRYRESSEKKANPAEHPGESLADFLRNSPAAAAIGAGELPEDAFDRRRDAPREIDFKP
jgi:hypothetical protein